MNKNAKTIATVRERERERESYTLEKKSAVLLSNLLIHTGKIKKERDICTNASNFGVQLKKEKLKSNVPTSNIKFPTSNSAITLVALVITIIVLLILAGVTLNMVMGDSGIFGKANNAKEKTAYANAQEKIKLAVMNSYNTEGELDYEELKESINNIEGLKEKIEGELDLSLKITVDNQEFVIKDTGEVIDKLPENNEQNPQPAGTEVEVKEGWNTKTVRATSVGEGNTIPVPKDFYYVGGTLSSGVVISDNKADRNKYAGIEDVPSGVEYNSDGTVNESKSELKGNQFVWIPCKADEYEKIDFGISNNNNWDKTTPDSEKAYIEKYSGFYIGRYEAGASKLEFANNKTLNAPVSTGWWNGEFVSSKIINNGKITCKAGEIPYYHADLKTATDMSTAMYSNSKYVESSLVTGTQWDMVMKFISKKEDYSDLKSTPWGNYTNGQVAYVQGQGKYIEVDGSTGIEKGSFTTSDNKYHYGVRTTASSENVKKNNLYDIAGNLWEWTAESTQVDGITSALNVLRGGSFGDSYAGSPACYRYCNYVTGTATSFGFRPALYVK